jgi:hypothetical protein
MTHATSSATSEPAISAAVLLRGPRVIPATRRSAPHSGQVSVVRPVVS